MRSLVRLEQLDGPGPGPGEPDPAGGFLGFGGINDPKRARAEDQAIAPSSGAIDLIVGIKESLDRSVKPTAIPP